MKLLEQNNWYARIQAELKVITPAEGFPLNIGKILITSNDGKREFILDPYETDFTNEGGDITFESRLEIDQETFPDCKYDLLVEDLTDCTVEFYCEPEEGNYYHNTAEFTLIIYFEDRTIEIPAVQEDSGIFDRLMSLRRRWILEDYQEAYDDEWDEIPADTDECWNQMQAHIAQTYDEDLIQECFQNELETYTKLIPIQK